MPALLELVPCCLIHWVRVADGLEAEAGEFNLFLFCFLVAGVAALCVVVAAGVLLGLLAIAAATGIGVAGIAGNAVLAGLMARSPEAGATALVLQFGAAIGMIFGMSACVLTRWLLGRAPLDAIPLAAGGALGAVLGTLVAWLSFRLVQSCFRRLKERLG